MGIKTKRLITKTRSCSCSMPGVWRAAAHSKGAAVIFHSPKACAHIARTMDSAEHFRRIAKDEYTAYSYQAPLISSLLSEKHSIFGGSQQLEDCIEYVVNTYSPKYLVIANSCVAGVIGDDVEAICSDAERRWNLPIITVPCYGFLDGEYYAGYFYTAEAMIDRLVEPEGKKSGKVLLLGDQGGPNGEYCREIKHLLSYFDLEVQGQFPTYVDYEQMNLVAASSLNIVLGSRDQTNEWLIKLAKKMEKNFGTPYYGREYPIGWTNTQKWLRGLGSLLNKKNEAEKAIIFEKNKLDEAVEKYGSKMKGKKTVICIGRLIEYFDPSWVIELIEKTGLELQGIILFDGYAQKDRAAMEALIKSICDKPVYSSREGEALIGKTDIVLTTHEIATDGIKQLFLPMLPRAGANGEIELIKKMSHVFSRKGMKGGIIYG